MNTPLPPLPLVRRLGGTTLVETAMAIGIFAFAIVAISGALGTGATATRHARDLNVISGIQQRLLSLVAERQGDVSALTQAFFFTSEGVELTNAAPDDWAYQARVQTSGDTPVAVPGGAANTNLYRVSIEVQSRSQQTNTASRFFLRPSPTP
jgi:uncharacterized protein (TIGR02598 family)